MKLIVLLIIIFFSSCVWNPKPKLIIPEIRRDEIFRQFVNPITDKYQLPQLREASLAKDDLEIRLWVSYFEIDGFILRRIKNVWSATAIREIDCKTIGWYPKNKSYELGKLELPPPKSGWENFWSNLNQLDVLNIAYSNYIPMIDEGSYKLETNTDGVYRIRFYGSRDESKEAAQMRKIGAVIADEFDLVNFKVGSLCSENNAKS